MNNSKILHSGSDIQYTIYMRSIQNKRIMREARKMDYKRLQEDLRDYFGSAMLSGFPMADIDD